MDPLLWTFSIWHIWFSDFVYTSTSIHKLESVGSGTQCVHHHYICKIIVLLQSQWIKIVRIVEVFTFTTLEEKKGQIDNKLHQYNIQYFLWDTKCIPLLDSTEAYSGFNQQCWACGWALRAERSPVLDSSFSRGKYVACYHPIFGLAVSEPGMSLLF